MSMMLFDFQNRLLRKRGKLSFFKSKEQHMNTKRKNTFIDFKLWKKSGWSKSRRIAMDQFS